MKDFQGKRRVRRLAYSWLAIILLALVAFFLFRSVVGLSDKNRLSRAKMNQSAAALAKMQAREMNLKTEIAKLETPTGVEEKLREKFGVAKEGEYMITIIDETGTSTVDGGQKKSFWYRLTHWDW